MGLTDTNRNRGSGWGSSPKPRGASTPLISRANGLAPYPTSGAQATGNSAVNQRDAYLGQIASQMYAPDMAALDNYGANLQRQLQRGDGGAGAAGRAAANRNYDIGMRQIGLQREGLDIDRGAANRQMGYYDQLGGIQGRQLDNSLGLLSQQRGFAGDSYMNQLATFDTQGRGIDANSAREQEMMMSAAIAGGAVASQGVRSDKSFIEGERTRAQSLLNNQRTEAKINYQERLANLDSQTRGLLLDHELNQLSNAEQKARLGDRLKQLDLTARQYDLNAEQLAANLQSAIDSIGAGESLRVGQLMDAINSNNAQKAQVGLQVVEQLMQLRGAGPDVTRPIFGF